VRALVVRTAGRCAPRRRSLPTRGAAIAVTFDDGPDPAHTPLVLDELARLGMVATFFVTGQRAERHPELVRRIVAAGHAVGSHSDTHPEPWRTSFRQLVADYRRGRRRVERAAGGRVRLFRPPYGDMSGSAGLAAMAARLRPWLWTLDSHDWEPGATAETIASHLTTLRAGDVVLLHDSIEGPTAAEAGDRRATVAALARLAELAAHRQLTFVALGA